MKTTDPKIALLRRLPALRYVASRELRRLASLVDECEVAAGDVLMREGTVGRASFVIAEGWAAVSQGGEIIAPAGPGEFVGEMALLDNQLRSATVIAKTPMRLLAISPADFTSFLDSAGVARGMATELARRLRVADGAMVEVEADATGAAETGTGG